MRIEDEIQQTSFKNEYQKLLINLMFTQAQLQTIHSQIFKPFELTPEQYNVLRILRGKHPQPMPLKDIQERMINRMSNTSRLVEKLKQKSLIRRYDCEHDRRALDITLTEQGLSLLETLQPIIEAQENSVHKLSIEEAQNLNRLLDKLRG